MFKRIYIASINPTKVNAVKKVFLDVDVFAIKVKTEINNQPLNDLETIKGAYLRASKLPIDGIRIGLEAGVKIIGEQVILLNWGVLIDENNCVYLAGGTNIPLPSTFKKDLYENNLELADIMDSFFEQKDIRSKQGAIGIFTKDIIKREDIFIQIVKLLYGQYLSNNCVEIKKILNERWK